MAVLSEQSHSVWSLTLVDLICENKTEYIKKNL